MLEFTERQGTIIQKMIRNEIYGALELPHIDTDYIKDLKEIYYQCSGGVDYWEGYDETSNV